IQEKAKQLATMMKQSKHIVMYTGAGISTSAKIPDYRGPKGVWTLRELNREKEIQYFDIEQALPAFGHYAITHLVKKGYVKFVVSTNLDGLHRRSGMGADKLAELHGNSYKESCFKCGKEYLRGFDTYKTVKDYRTHITGRKCSCGGDLKDTIIHFGENLPEKDLLQSVAHSKAADLAIVLGTSMKVSPACNLPLKCLEKGGKMCIVNLQKTDYDSKSELRVFSKTDEFLKLVLEYLGELDNVDTSYDALSSNWN
ncbi:silent information regulator family protein, partial [Naegleria gruberi]